MPGEPRRILLVCPESTGGIGRHVAMLGRQLRLRGEHVTIAAPASTIARLSLADAAHDAVAIDAGRPSAAVDRALRRLTGGHDVVHAHGVRASAACAIASRTPLVSTWHNAPLGNAGRRTLHAALERISARRSGVVLGASADLVARARTAGARAAMLCPVVTPLPAAARREPARPPIVLAIARLHPQKRIDLLVDASAGWGGRADGARVVIVGDGPLRRTLEQQAHSKQAPVEFVGASDDVTRWLSRATVVALPSDWEARALVAQEALSAGVPLVATRVGGIPELVGDAAVLVPAGDADSLRRALEQVLGDATLREQLSTAGPVRAATWPDAGAMTDVVVSAYDEVTTAR